MEMESILCCRSDTYYNQPDTVGVSQQTPVLLDDSERQIPTQVIEGESCGCNSWGQRTMSSE